MGSPAVGNLAADIPAVDTPLVYNLEEEGHQREVDCADQSLLFLF